MEETQRKNRQWERKKGKKLVGGKDSSRGKYRATVYKFHFLEPEIFRPEEKHTTSNKILRNLKAKDLLFFIFFLMHYFQETICNEKTRASREREREKGSLRTTHK